MKTVALAALAGLVACAGAPPPMDNPLAPGAMGTELDVGGEAQALERAETECAKDGKHAVSERVDGEMVYNCAD